jgi:hypothetical protein
MFTNKYLVIPDYTIASHVPLVYKYFDDFNIAKLNNVTYYDYPPEENDDDEPFYGYIIIEVEEWFDNVTSRNFYNAIVDNNCKMVYDDPKYWDVEFYDNSEIDYDAIEKDCIYNSVKKECDDEEKVNLEHPPSHELDEEEVSDEVNEEDVSDEVDDEEVSDELDEEEGEEGDDLKNDPDYVYEEEDESKDKFYEYFNLMYKMVKNKNKKEKTNKRKYNEEIEKLTYENNELKMLLVKKNKNYLKNNKSKDFKNAWSRRLRQKLIHEEAD